jgi:hypothetical protein
MDKSILGKSTDTSLGTADAAAAAAAAASTAASISDATASNVSNVIASANKTRRSGGNAVAGATGRVVPTGRDSRAHDDAPPPAVVAARRRGLLGWLLGCCFPDGSGTEEEERSAVAGTLPLPASASTAGAVSGATASGAAALRSQCAVHTRT